MAAIGSKAQADPMSMFVLMTGSEPLYLETCAMVG